jgi:hypothetical protein
MTSQAAARDTTTSAASNAASRSGFCRTRSTTTEAPPATSTAGKRPHTYRTASENPVETNIPSAIRPEAV